MYSWTFSSASHLGWLAAPLISLLLDFCGFSLFRGTPILAGGIGVARAVVGAVAWCWFSVSSNCESVNLLVTRLG